MAVIFPPPNAYKDLFSRVNRNHLQYLCEEQYKERLKYRNKLESSITEYLSVENHCNKFIFQQTADILRSSVQSDNFNVFKVRDAWEAVSNYSRNLYNQPWRIEYREIRLYSGFYKHQIESHLHGVEVLFEIMGYKLVDHKMVLEKEINAQSLCNTSLDALMAMCECQILCCVYEEVIKQIPHCTWSDILRFRERYPASTEETIHGMITLYQLPTDCCIDCCPWTDLIYPGNFQSGYRNYSDVDMKTKYFSSNGYCSNYPRDGSSYQLQDNRVMYANGLCGHVPTAKLIELDDSFENCHSQQHRKCVGTWLQNDYSKFMDNLSSDNNTLFDDDARKLERPNSKNSRKSWDYVSERLDKEKSKSDHGSRSFHLPRSSKPNGISGALTKLTLGSNSESRLDTLDGRKRSDIVVKPNSLQMNRSNGGNNKSDHSNKKRTSPTWACITCTFYNKVSKDVCEMCGKSRYACDEPPLERGGKQCNRCTLVNKKKAEQCEACNSNLKNSSTYV